MEKTFRALAGITALALLPILAGTFSGCAGNDPTLTALSNNYGKSYAVVVSEKTYADIAWKEIADTLTRKHAATLIVYSGSLENCRPDLAKKMPRYTAFVATPDECAAGTNAVAIAQITHALDNDPYADTIYGIITGGNSADTLRLAINSKTIYLKEGEIAAADSGNKETYLNARDNGEIAQSVRNSDNAGAKKLTSEILALWQTPPGRNTLADSFFFATAPEKMTPENSAAFYGDPARKALIEPAESSFISGGIVSSGSTHTLTLEIVDGPRATLNETPIGVLFTQRLKNPKIISGTRYDPILADNFILLRKPQPIAGETEIVVKFEGDPGE